MVAQFAVIDRVKSVIASQVRLFKGEYLGIAGVIILVLFTILGIFGPYIAPYAPRETVYSESGRPLLAEGPSLAHPFGTTTIGQDVFSQTLIAARVSLIVGFATAIIIILLGTSIGIVSGYYGGRVDQVLMRLTDLVIALPFIPFLIMMMLIIEATLFNIILVISFLAWRIPARVIRSQVLSVKERPYIESAEMAGAGNIRLMFRHILPNILPIVMLYGAISIASGIMAEASLSFIGFGDPNQLSWGLMLNEAHANSATRNAPWWVIPPGMGLASVMTAAFLVSRVYEKITNPEIQTTAA